MAAGTHGQSRSGRCTAHSSRTGEPCKNRAMAGTNVCRAHGGAAPQVKAKAAERLKEARDLALEKLTEQLTGGSVESKVLLEACVKLTELTETLDGHVARREEVRHEYEGRSDEDLIHEAEAILRDTSR